MGSWLESILGDQGQITEARGSLNGQRKMATKKSIVGREEPLAGGKVL